MRSEEEGWHSLPHSGLVASATRVGGGCRWKIQHRKIVPLSLSLLMSKNLLNSKVLKSFVPELRSGRCFSYFGIPMFYEYMFWTFYIRFPYSCMGMVQLHPSDLFRCFMGARSDYVSNERVQALCYCKYSFLSDWCVINQLKVIQSEKNKWRSLLDARQKGNEWGIFFFFISNFFFSVNL